MMATASLLDPRSLAEMLVRRHGAPFHSIELRRQALEAYLESPPPDRVQHLWRYTDPALLTPSDVALENAARGVGEAVRARIEIADEAKAQGVRVLDLHEAAVSAPELLALHLGKLVGGTVTPHGIGKFEALNLGLWSIGTLIHVPRRVQVARPIHVSLTVPQSTTEAFLATRLLVILEEGAEATIVDECDGGNEFTRLNAAVEIFVGQAANAKYVSVQRLNKGAAYHATERASVARDAQSLTAIASLGGGVTKSNFGSHLRGPGAHVELFGFLFGEQKQHFDHHTVHSHESGKTYSNLDFKVVLKGRSRSAYTGLIRIEPGCPDSEAYQENRNLLLNDGARAESIPELEILTDEVKCTHGATVGTLDAQHIFYLMSRGIDRAEAIRLIVGGFIEPTLSRLDGDLSQRLREQVEERVRDL